MSNKININLLLMCVIALMGTLSVLDNMYRNYKISECRNISLEHNIPISDIKELCK